MDYNSLLDLAADLAYRLAMCGAETYRVEESVNHVMLAYGVEAEIFAIPNCLTVSIETAEGKPMTRMRRIGYHDNDLDSVERYTSLSRRICAEKPEPQLARHWLQEADHARRSYSLPMLLVGNFLAGSGFAIFFGATLADSMVSGVLGVIVGLIVLTMDKLKANLFFRTILASFVMALLAYSLATFGIVKNADTTIIGTLMLLVPGLLFTNAMRDIIYGDTNSGINRIVQVFLIAVAIALGTAAAWNSVAFIWQAPVNLPSIEYSLWIQLIGCMVGCYGFAVLFNIHGPGCLLCVLGGVLTWIAYLVTVALGGSDLTAYFWASLFASGYAEIMARIRKFPAISYLVVSIFPLIPGASVYYTMNHAVRGDMTAFAETGTHTIAIAGCIAVGVLLMSTVFRIFVSWKRNRIK